VAHTTAFHQVIGERPRLEQVVPLDAHEGPVYLAGQDALYLTSVPVPSADDPPRPLVAIRRVQLDGLRFPVDPTAVTTLRQDANAANGMALDRDGRLVVCEQGGPDRSAAITSVDPTTGTLGPHRRRECGEPILCVLRG
jgi:gluconolactonase